MKRRRIDQGDSRMRILVADDQPRVKYAMRVLLETQPGVQVVGEAMDVQGLLAETKANRPDLVLLDWELPGLATVDSLSALRQACPGLRVVALSGRPEARQAALLAGVDAFISKMEPPDRLLALVNGASSAPRLRSPASRQGGDSNPSMTRKRNSALEEILD